MTDLIERLREVGGMRHDGATRWYINPDGPEAANRIEKLEAALRRLIDYGMVSYQDLERAQKALEGKDD